MSKSSLKRLLALLVAIIALVAQPIFGGPITPPNTLLVLTEESSTVLTATTTGGASFGTVSLLAVDQWSWMLPADRPAVTSIVPILPNSGWLEPEAPPVDRLVNFVQIAIFDGGVGGLTLFSEFDSSQNANPVFPDSTIVLGYFTVNYVGGGSETFDLQIIDKGDAASAPGVPDTGTTCSLLGLSLTGVAFLRRKLR